MCMKKNNNVWILSTLKAHGHKQTPSRVRIGEYIIRHTGIFSAHNIMRTYPTMDKVTVYRTLELFQSLDIIHPLITIEGVEYYELHGNAHHHHIICTSCKKTACVSCALPHVSAPGFTNLHHVVIVTGLCTTCGKK